MITNDNKKSQKIASYFCENCEYITGNKADFNKHLLTAKHRNTDAILTNTDFNATKVASNMFKCKCGKEYKHRQSLFNHRKIFKSNEHTDIELYDENQKTPEITQLITYLMNENSELKNITISFGGSDPQDISFILLDFLSEFDNKFNITFILGKRTANLSDGYNLFIETDASTHFPDFEFEYGNYVLICGTYTKDNVIKYNITESKIVTSPSSQKGYYPEINPIYINDTQQSNNFINLENIKTNDDGLGFIPNGPGTYITLNLFNDETAQLYGYQKFINQSSEVYAAVNNIVNIIPNNPINSRYEFPDNFKIIVDVPLDCYDEGKSQNILSFIPNAITSSGFIVYQPSPPLFITLKNTNPIYLDHINFKLYDNNSQLLPDQVSSSAVLIIQSIKQ
jgi:hypothetical protein